MREAPFGKKIFKKLFFIFKISKKKTSILKRETHLLHFDIIIKTSLYKFDNKFYFLN